MKKYILHIDSNKTAAKTYFDDNKIDNVEAFRILLIFISFFILLFCPRFSVKDFFLHSTLN